MENGNMRIDFSPKVKPIIKAVLSIRGFLMLLIAIGALHTCITYYKESLLVAFICLAVFIFFLILSKKFLEQVFFHEYLILKRDAICVYYKTFLQEKEMVFPLNHILQFGFAGQQKYTNNAMHNNVIDFTGLEASEKEMQYIIDNGTLEIVSNEMSHRFGKNMASWDAETVIEKVENYFGRKFQMVLPQ